jgi:hypothetical protein
MPPTAGLCAASFEGSFSYKDLHVPSLVAALAGT